MESFTVGDLVYRFCDLDGVPNDVGVIIKLVPNDYYGVAVVLWLDGVVSNESLLFITKLSVSEEEKEEKQSE